MVGKSKVADEQIVALYNKGYNDGQIAETLGYHDASAVCRRRNKLNLPPHIRRFGRNEVLKLWNAGLADAAIAKRLGCSRRTVWKRRRELGLTSIVGPSKFAELHTEVKKLWLMGISRREIAEKLGISKSTLYLWCRKLNLPRRSGGLSHRQIYRRQARCYGLRKQGYTDEEIADKLQISENRVKLNIGRFLMRQCRVTVKCPYKALLPETEI